jgi:iron-sulfur cluster repair protein YtfE (RIC family)
MLKKDHRDVERILERLSDAEGRERQQLVELLDKSLQLHMRMEEELLYPLVPQIEDQETEEEAEIEHGLAREGVSKLRALVDAPGFGAAVEMLKGGISHHVEEEESSLLPAMKKGLGKERWARIGDQMAAMKAATPLPEMPPELRRASAAKKTAKKATKRATPAKRATAKRTTARASASKKAATKRTRPAAKKTGTKKAAASRSTASRRRTTAARTR